MSIYDEAEKELASLLGLQYNDGRTREVLTPTWRTTEGGGPKGIADQYGFRTNPAHDDRDCFDLMVAHDCYPKVMEGRVAVALKTAWGHVEHLDQHHDKKLAVRYAIVMSVICKLKQLGDSNEKTDT